MKTILYLVLLVAACSCATSKKSRKPQGKLVGVGIITK